jgi:hypothetical protein
VSGHVFVLSVFQNTALSGQFQNTALSGQFQNTALSGQFQNTALSGQFQNQRAKSQKEAKLTHLTTLVYKSISKIFLPN